MVIIDYSLSLEGVSIAGQPVNMTISVKTPGQTTVGAATNLQDIVIFTIYSGVEQSFTLTVRYPTPSTIPQNMQSEV